jgi:hypothetical protein
MVKNNKGYPFQWEDIGGCTNTFSVSVTVDQLVDTSLRPNGERKTPYKMRFNGRYYYIYRNCMGACYTKYGSDKILVRINSKKGSEKWDLVTG